MSPVTNIDSFANRCCRVKLAPRTARNGCSEAEDKRLQDSDSQPYTRLAARPLR